MEPQGTSLLQFRAYGYHRSSSTTRRGNRTTTTGKANTRRWGVSRIETLNERQAWSKENVSSGSSTYQCGAEKALGCCEGGKEEVMLYNGTFRIIENRPYFGTVVDGMPMQVGLFGEGFQLGIFVDAEWLPLYPVIIKCAYVDDATGEMKMEWTTVRAEE
jgi:hypothetical protein